MPSLRQLQARAPLLLIDAASSRVHVGVLDAAEGSWRWTAGDDEAGIAVFAGVEKLGVNLDAVAAFAFCDGPGSVLGIRTAAVALRTWGVLRARPMFAFCSLAVVAHALGRSDVGVIADARRDAWHHYQIGRGLRRLPVGALRDGAAELVTPREFRAWATLPEGVASVSYALPELLLRPEVREADLFLPTEAPDAFLHEEPSYITWTPQIHRAPGER